MSEPVKLLTRANFKPEIGEFELLFQREDGKKLTMLIPPSQYLQFVAYHGKVAKSYIEWMKSGGK